MLSTIGLIVIGSAIGAYIIYITSLFFLQNKLLFARPPPDLLLYKELLPFKFDVKTKNGIFLQGWNTEGQSKASKTVIIYFGGNAQDASAMIPYLKDFDVSQIYTVNYRGYGLSEGKPTEKNLYYDALEIFDHIRKTTIHTKTIVMGYSLGSAVAGHVARHRSTSKLILLCPLQSVLKIAKERLYVFSPSVKARFELNKTAKHIKTRTLVITAENDSIIPASHSRLTFDSLNCEKTLITLRNCDHNDVFSNAEMLKYINRFITQENL